MSHTKYKTGGKSSATAISRAVRPTAEERIAIARAVDTAQGFQGGRIRLPEDSLNTLASSVGMDAETARMLAESFPAPNPDIVRAKRLRMIAGPNDRGYYTVAVCIPSDVLHVVGWRLGDTILLSAWADGCVRLTRVPEGLDE